MPSHRTNGSDQTNRTSAALLRDAPPLDATVIDLATRVQLVVLLALIVERCDVSAHEDAALTLLNAHWFVLACGRCVTVGHLISRRFCVFLCAFVCVGAAGEC